MAAASSTTKVVIPTGFEPQQRSIEAKRKLAQMMLEQGLSNDPRMTSWAQVLAHLAQTWAGKSGLSDAEKLQGTLDTQIRGSYNQGNTAIDNLVGKSDLTNPADLRKILDIGNTNPLLGEALKPYADAYTTVLNERAKPHMFGNILQTVGQSLGQEDPGKRTDSVIGRPGGGMMVNPVATGRAVAAQGLLPPEMPVEQKKLFYSQSGPSPTMGSGAPQMSNALPGPSGPPMSNAPPMTPITPQAPSPGGNMVDISSFNPEEKKMFMDYLQHRQGGGNSALGGPPANIPMGSPLTARPRPTGVYNGQPYWMVNGEAYDNPEGQ